MCRDYANHFANQYICHHISNHDYHPNDNANLNSVRIWNRVHSI
jgi:hypothetical protein